jgi:hypothetical protein
MSQLIYNRRRDNKPKASTTSGIAAAGKSRDSKTLTKKIIKNAYKSS